MLRHDLTNTILEARNSFHRLALLACADSTCRHGDFQEYGQVLSLGRALSEGLLDLSGRQRVFRVGRLVEEMVSESRGDVVVIDHLDLLFTTELAQDPLLLLQKLGRATNRTIVAVWPGRFEGETLVHAEPGHREYRRYTRPECIVISLSEAAVAP